MKNKRKIYLFITFALVTALSVSNLFVQPTSAANSLLKFTMNSDHILATQISATIENSDPHLSFDEAMEELKIEEPNTADGRTAVFFEDEDHEQEGILKAEVDFVAKAEPKPIDAMFLMDQSGSMNMGAVDSYHHITTSPCQNPDHYYRLHVLADGVSYAYYMRPSELSVEGTWQSEALKSEARDKAKQYIEELTNTAVKSISVITFTGTSFIPNHVHYSSNVESPARVFPIPTGSSFDSLVEIEKADFTKIELRKVSGAKDTFFSNSDFSMANAGNSADYFRDLYNQDQCIDKMLMSKIIFADLADEIVSSSSQNQIAFANFAKDVKNSRGFSNELFSDEDKFSDTTGYTGTSYSDAFKKAEEMFSANLDRSHAQDVVFFITDGTPYGGISDPDALSAYIDSVMDPKTVIYFIGIGLSQDTIDKWGPVVATTNSEGEVLAYSIDSIDKMEEVLTQEILTTALDYTVTMGDDFSITIDEDHPMVFEWIDGFGEKNSKTVTSIEEAIAFGVTFDGQKIIWDSSHLNITAGRMSYYHEFDKNKIDWTTINQGLNQVETSIKDIQVNYVDYLGTVSEHTMSDFGKIALSGNSTKLSVSLDTTTSSNIHSGDTITYNVTVNNTGNIDVKDLVVYNPLPANTEFTGSGTLEGNNVIFDVGSLARNSNTTFSFSLLANGTSGDVINSVRLGVADQKDTFLDGLPILTSNNMIHTITQSPPTTTQPVVPSPTTTTTQPVETTQATQTTQTTQTTQSTQTPETTPTTQTTSTLATQISSVVKRQSPTTQTQQQDAHIEITPEGNISITNTKQPVEIEIGGKPFDLSDILVEDNQIILPLEMLSSLPDGEHTLTITFEDGTKVSSKIIMENGVPLSAGDLEAKDIWSLFDLIITVVLILLLLLRSIKDFIKKDKSYNDKSYNDRTKHSRINLAVGFVITVITVVALIITQNFRLTMVFFDGYSLYFGILFVVYIGAWILIPKSKTNKEQDN